MVSLFNVSMKEFLENTLLLMSVDCKSIHSDLKSVLRLLITRKKSILDFRFKPYNFSRFYFVVFVSVKWFHLPLLPRINRDPFNFKFSKVFV
ncbi:hypothetical protein EFP84_19365 [Leptospira kmetyi]|uniref:Uncharacterized protein n=1 Tax=Leptospira kmetyi TaxID=408139 RepID=A0AAD0XSG9_9LEPT|nr:hypothetical protein EFP84_19365 [Leptospira kmetyi]